MYKDYKISILLQSGVGTPWQSDTIFGHLAWQVAFGNLKSYDINSFMLLFEKGKNPPFILSDGFPKGLFPKPVLSLQRTKTNIDKNIKKAKYLKEDGFREFCIRGLKESDISNFMYSDDPWISSETLHATLDRRTETTGNPDEGGAGNLYTTEGMFLKNEFSNVIEIYLRSSEEWKEHVGFLLTEVSKIGFGRDKSVGCGKFKLENIEQIENLGLSKGSNACVSLSTYIPSENDPVIGFWKYRIKYGKIGENLDLGNPFKKPIIQLEPGAVFYTEREPQKFYGRMINDIAPGLPEAIQNGFAFTVPIYLGEDILKELLVS